MPKSYKQKLTDSRIVNGGRAKKNHDPFSGGGDRELVAKHNLARQSLGTEGGYVSPQGIKANAHIAMQLGGADLYNTMMDAGRERVAPAEYRALNGAADGNDGLKDAAKQVGDDVKVQYIKKQDDPKLLANLLLSEDESRKIKPPTPQMMAPPAPSGLMGGGDKT
jgi:Ca2+-binding RTX toxin-like protein